MKVIGLILITLVLAAPASAAQRRDDHSSRSLKLWPQQTLRQIVPNWKFFIAIGRCEQPAPVGKHGRRYKWGIDWHHPGPSYPGGLGVWAPLWREKGIAGIDMAPSADKATPIEQMIHAQRIINKYGVYAWGCTGRALASAPYFDVKG